MSQTRSSDLHQPAGSEIEAALRQVFPVFLAVFPFGMVYGAIAIGDGLTLLEAMGFSATVFAGASQLAALQLIGIGAPVWTVLLTVFALNFRHILYSASIGRHLTRFSPAAKAAAFFLLVDPIFGAAEARAAERPLTKRYYFTYGMALYICWLASTLIGALFGSLIEEPEAFGLDFVLPVYFLALVMTFRSRRTFWPVAGTSAIVSIAVTYVIGPPWHVTLGALAGIAVAAAMKPPERGETHATEREA
ncbi:AzlC family ABC transporter permease [Fulvimarina manganoxydans]|uniref:AzlC family ABC transporter permease n=1 Tax=Fulvimarina manganoxydans TaxID=937218 RepID=UPI0023567ACC|nr:AzlC family ABC transporter permease [Fulvimarina manganoxydans]